MAGGGRSGLGKTIGENLGGIRCLHHEWQTTIFPALFVLLEDEPLPVLGVSARATGEPHVHTQPRELEPPPARGNGDIRRLGRGGQRLVWEWGWWRASEERQGTRERER